MCHVQDEGDKSPSSSFPRLEFALIQAVSFTLSYAVFPYASLSTRRPFSLHLSCYHDLQYIVMSFNMGEEFCFIHLYHFKKFASGLEHEILHMKFILFFIYPHFKHLHCLTITIFVIWNCCYSQLSSLLQMRSPNILQLYHQSMYASESFLLPLCESENFKC